MTAEVINTKQGLTRIPTYAELITEIDREKFKTNDIRKIFDRNAWYFHESSQGQALNTNNIHPADLQQMNLKRWQRKRPQGRKKKHPTRPKKTETIYALSRIHVASSEQNINCNSNNKKHNNLNNKRNNLNKNIMKEHQQ